MYCVGFGFDVHRLKKSKRTLSLAGVDIPSDLSLEAVSDGDVVLHAVADGILGASGKGDIGDLFPPEAPSSRNIDSKNILKKVLRQCRKGYKVVNLDVTIVAEKPRLVKHKQAMQRSLIKLLGTKRVNIKIKSKEGLSILGAKDAISCLVCVLLKRC